MQNKHARMKRRMSTIIKALRERQISINSSRGSRSVVGQLLRHRGPQAGLFVVICLHVLALFAPLLATHGPILPSLSDRLSPPSRSHWFGTDGLGRDVFSRMLFGARYSLSMGFLATICSVIIGGPIGFLAGFYAGSQRGWIDGILMRIMDIMLAFPALLLALLLVSALGPSLENAVIAVVMVSVPIYARLARGSVLVVKEREYVTAARVCGTTDLIIVIRHILPNSIQPLIVQGTLGVGAAILVGAALSFLGLGVRPPTPEWGAMIYDGRGVLETAPWVAGFPGLGVLATVLGINLLGDGLRDALDPRIRVGRG